MECLYTWLRVRYSISLTCNVLLPYTVHCWQHSWHTVSVSEKRNRPCQHRVKGQPWRRSYDHGLRVRLAVCIASVLLVMCYYPTLCTAGSTHGTLSVSEKRNRPCQHRVKGQPWWRSYDHGRHRWYCHWSQCELLTRYHHCSSTLPTTTTAAELARSICGWPYYH